jgi:cadmium resistance transport/sequestration family protein
MSHFFTAIPAGITAFTATNLDDILILLLFFSQVNAWFRHRHIVAGQYLGFAALVLASLPGFFGGMLLPQAWIGMVGIVPIAIGVGRLLNRGEEVEEDVALMPSPSDSYFSNILSPQTVGVASITFANGGDNIGIYVPLFASCNWETLLITLAMFFSLVGVWCYTAFQLVRVPTIADTLTRYGNFLVPFVLIGLGVMILLESHTLENRGLLVLALITSGLTGILLSRNSQPSSMEENT